MKKIIALSLALIATVAFAGDEPIAQVSYTGTAGCSAILRPNTRYAVQPTTDAYVRVTSDTTNATATSNSVKVSADKLYDAWTTNAAGKRYICCVQVSTAGTCKIFLYEGEGTP